MVSNIFWFPYQMPAKIVAPITAFFARNGISYGNYWGKGGYFRPGLLVLDEVGVASRGSPEETDPS
jgi:hypothetical protein